jgi:hypothetical protein
MGSLHDIKTGERLDVPGPEESASEARLEDRHRRFRSYLGQLKDHISLVQGVQYSTLQTGAPIQAVMPKLSDEHNAKLDNLLTEITEGYDA